MLCPASTRTRKEPYYSADVRGADFRLIRKFFMQRNSAARRVLGKIKVRRCLHASNFRQRDCTKGIDPFFSIMLRDPLCRRRKMSPGGKKALAVRIISWLSECRVYWILNTLSLTCTRRYSGKNYRSRFATKRAAASLEFSKIEFAPLRGEFNAFIGSSFSGFFESRET